MADLTAARACSEAIERDREAMQSGPPGSRGRFTPRVRFQVGGHLARALAEVDRLEAERDRLQGQVLALAEEREAIQMLVPLGRETGPNCVQRYIHGMEAENATLRALHRALVERVEAKAADYDSDDGYFSDDQRALLLGLLTPEDRAVVER